MHIKRCTYETAFSFSHSQSPCMVHARVLGVRTSLRAPARHWGIMAPKRSFVGADDLETMTDQITEAKRLASDKNLWKDLRKALAIAEHDKMALIPMSNETKLAVYQIICPAEWLTAMRLAGSDISRGSAQE